MSNTSPTNTVVSFCKSATVVERIPWKESILEFFRKLIRNSDISFNGATKTVKFDYTNHGRHYCIECFPFVDKT